MLFLGFILCKTQSFSSLRVSRCFSPPECHYCHSQTPVLASSSARVTELGSRAPEQLMGPPASHSVGIPHFSHCRSVVERFVLAQSVLMGKTSGGSGRRLVRCVHSQEVERDGCWRLSLLSLFSPVWNSIQPEVWYHPFRGGLPT